MAGQLITYDVCIAPSPRPQNHTLPSSTITAPAPPAIGFGAALAQARKLPRASLPFRSVNQRDAPGYDPGIQRHHLLPRQVLSARCFGHLFEQIGRGRIGFDDFRSNGLLLPASDASAVRIGLPLHRGPHRQYNAMVLERVGQVEASWSALRLRAPEIALDEALMRLRLLQAALRRRLLDPGAKRFSLNRFDPLGREADFAQTDAMADALWPATEPAVYAVFEAGVNDTPGRRMPVNTAETALILPGGPHDDAPGTGEGAMPMFGVRMAARPGRTAFAF